MAEVILIRGVPGSGKSTLARKMVEENDCLIHVEADDFFMRDGVYAYESARVGEAHEHCRQRANHALADGYSVVIANTFSRLWEMETYYRLAAAYGADVRVITATGRYQNVHGVPQEVVDRMTARWEAA